MKFFHSHLPHFTFLGLNASINYYVQTCNLPLVIDIRELKFAFRSSISSFYAICVAEQGHPKLVAWNLDQDHSNNLWSRSNWLLSDSRIILL